MKKKKLSTYQKRSIIEDVYGPFIAAALDQQKTLSQITLTDPGNEEAFFAFTVADRLLGFLQTKNAGEFRKVPADPVQIQVKKNNGRRYYIRERGGEQTVPEIEADGEAGFDIPIESPAALPDGS